MMNRLPSHLFDEILFRLQPKSLAKLRCVDKSLQSYISDDPIFQSDYFSRLRSTLLHISIDGAKLQPLISSTSGESPSSRIKDPLPIHYNIIGSSSGLLLFFINGLCVVNPLTKKFKFLDHSSSKLFPMLLYSNKEDPTTSFIRSHRKIRIGLAVDQIDRNTQRFKIVCLFNLLAPNRIDTIYLFEIYSEDSWRLAKTTLICSASELYNSTKPVYINGVLHWLRIDGSIIAFDLESEEVRLISVEFPEEVNSKVVLCVGENRMKLVSASKEVIWIYELEIGNGNILWRWNLVKEIENVKFDEGNLLHWNVEAFDGRCVVVREGKVEEGDGVIYGFELRDECKKWKVLGSIPWWGDKCRDFYLFVPSWDEVVGLDEMLMMKDVCHDHDHDDDEDENEDDDGDDDDDDSDDDDDGDVDGRVTSLREIIRLIHYCCLVGEY